MSFKRCQTLAVTRRSSSLTLSTSASTWTRRSTLPAVGTSSAFFCCGHRVQGVSVRLPPVCRIVRRGCRAGGRGELGRDQRAKLLENISPARERAHLILVRGRGSLPRTTCAHCGFVFFDRPPRCCARACASEPLRRRGPGLLLLPVGTSCAATPTYGKEVGMGRSTAKRLSRRCRRASKGRVTRV